MSEKVECPVCKPRERMYWNGQKCSLCNGAYYITQELAGAWVAQQERADLVARLRAGSGEAFVAGNEAAAHLLREAAAYVEHT